MSPDRSEQHPLYPSGEWEGFYTYPAPFSFKDQMAFHLDFCDGVVTGSGSDNVGSFRWEGTYHTGRGICRMRKYYHGRHSVFYDGRVDENGIWGTWAIHASWTGGFHIWPKKGGAEEEKIEIEQIQKPEEVSAWAILGTASAIRGKKLCIQVLEQIVTLFLARCVTVATSLQISILHK